MTPDDDVRELRQEAELHEGTCHWARVALRILDRLEAAERDAARLDWLDKTGHEDGHSFCHVGYGDYRFYAHATNGKWSYPSAREVIDAAMKGSTP